ncbi:ferritin-like domain-containing protein [Pukyongiella litopenaei]|uniref:ferritin-like domain-containing protein n=1 Tax=Pukyongiella litopenaei TaxID=2605946 RepID=UPI0024536B57|nr:ferritin-like domain-containing protein [Pukyongiella litopenaei]
MSNTKIIEYLQRALKMELTAAHQYQLHAHTLDDWGMTKLADLMRKEMAEEMEHSDRFIERLYFLKVKPEMGFDKVPTAAETLPAVCVKAISKMRRRQSPSTRRRRSMLQRSEISARAPFSKR